ncbi:Oidioi.mRNA.OKI2018_I69.chr2.g5777.t3.cds [Oikopleura dioica]|uniref:Oidioi.mRNA.OKI2018_I69.chr2.g5777.t3.cds n=1 Tax=Oikopleura dioica TaxID=34765 RepID=A0ABN7TAG2_OIKDI|nr:Oidioi.mRNA.OKI2018_I69.chr2.g5777.t3.cds [Oikopleura dioica]
MDGTEIIETPGVHQIPTSDTNTDVITSSAAALQQLNNSLLNGNNSPHNFNGSNRTNDSQGNTDANGNFTYVMLNSQGQGERNLTQIIPRANLDIYNSQMSLQSNSNRAIQKDMARRQQHNEVERRRRDKINTWINKISKVVPDCSDDHTKQGQSKGGILAKAYEYILELQTKISTSCQNTYDKEDVEQLIDERNRYKREADKLRIELQQYQRALEEKGWTVRRVDDTDD